MAINNNLLVWSKDLSKGFRVWGSGTLSFPTDSTVGNNMVAHIENSSTDGLVALSDMNQMISVKPGETYTVSADFKTNHSGEIYFAFKCLDKNKTEIVTLGNYGNRTVTWDTWYRISGTMTVPDGIAYIYATYRFKNTSGVYPSGLSIYHPKLELGNIATDYRPAGVESPNLIRNSHFYKGTDYWNSASQAAFSLKMAEDESLQIKREQDVTAIHAYTYITKPLELSKTYTLTAEVKNNSDKEFNGRIFYVGDSVGNGLASGAALPAVIPADNQYHTFTKTFTMSSSGATGGQLVSTSTDYQNGQSLWIRSIKLEEGTYQTEWTAAPEDVAIGIDREVIATAQKTIFDYNDTVGLVANITSNLSMTQQYSPEIEKFTPDWTTTNVVLTASLYKNNDETNIITDSNIQSIKWYKVSAIDGANPVLISNDSSYVIGTKTLTIKQNVLNDKSSIDYICEIVYRDPLTNQDLLAKKSITFNRVINGAVLTKARAYLPNGNSFTGDVAENETNGVYRTNVLPGTMDWTGWLTNNSTVTLTNNTYGGGLRIQTQTANWNYLYLPSSKNPLVSGEQYTASVWLRADIAGKILPFVSVGTDKTITTGGNTILRALTTSSGDKYPSRDWKLFKTTFVFNSSGNENKTNIRVEASGFPSDGTANTLYIAGFKIEKGNAATRWSMAPEDYPAIRPETTPQKWMFSTYDNQEASPTSIASYSDIKEKTPLKKSLISDVVNLALNTENHYTGHLQTAIYSPIKRDLPFSFKSKNPTTIYVNNEKAYASGINLVPNSAVEKSNTSVVTYEFNLAEVLTPYIGQEVTISFDAKADGPDNVHYIDWYLRDGSGNTGKISLTSSPTETLNGEYRRISQTIIVPDDVAKVTTGGSIAVRTNAYVPGVPSGDTNSGSASVKNMKIELGNVATPWYASPSDGINLIDTSTIGGHGSSLVPTDSYEGVPTYLNTVTTPNVGNNFGYRINKAIPFVSTGPTTFTLSFKYNIAAYSNAEQGRPMSGYVRVRNVDGTQSTYLYTTPSPNDPANLNKWITVIYTFTTDQAITSIDNFYFFTDLASEGTNMKVTAPKLEVGAIANPFWTRAPEEEIRATTLPLKEGWNTIDALWTSENGVQTGLFNVQAGGINIMKKSNQFKPVPHSTAGGIYPSITKEGYLQVKTDAVNGNWHEGWASDYTGIEDSFAEGDDVVISFEMKSPDHTKIPKIYIKDGMGYFSLKGTMSKEFSQVWLTTKWKKANNIRMHLGWSGIEGTTIVKNMKIERGTIPSPWTAAPDDVAPANPNMFSTVYKLDDYYTENYANRLTSITAKAELTRGSIVDTTNVTYQWYKQDPSVKTDQGGGVGWLKLINTSPEAGYNTDTLTIPSTAINTFEVYKCMIKDTQIDSITYNTLFETIVSVTNSTLPISVQVETDGTVFLNGQGNKTLKARLFQNFKEVDTEGTIYSYKWYRWLSDGTIDASWNNGTGYKTGKTLVIGPADVDQKATFSVDVS